METVILLMSGFLCTHFLVDFVLQTPFQYRNKGTYGHAGGLLHAGASCGGNLCGVSKMRNSCVERHSRGCDRPRSQRVE